jgi:hypothetical protein
MCYGMKNQTWVYHIDYYLGEITKRADADNILPDDNVSRKHKHKNGKYIIE